jgi:hypothetical protein
MTPEPAETGRGSSSHGASIPRARFEEDIERQMALAWAWLAAEHDAFPQMRRVTVLRPVAL